MAAMRIPALRFPGGIVCNAYNWRHGTGPVHLRNTRLDAAFHQDWHLKYDFGLDEYLQICLEQGITPTLTFNVATGTPEEAAEWAAYCEAWFRKAGVEPPLIYWHIANHPYHETTAHMTPAMYVNVLKTYVPVAKANYPRCRIVGVMSRAELTGSPERTAWKQALFAEAADLIDVVQFQDYGGCDPEADPVAQLAALEAKLRGTEADTRAFIAECRARKVRWTVGIAEWNWWLQASHWDGRAFEEPPTVLHGLFIAGMVHRFAALAPDFEVAHFYNLVNCMGILNHRGADIEVTDAVRIFNLYRPALPGQRVPLAVAAEGGRDASQVDALCLVNEEATWLFAVNRSLSETMQIETRGFPVDEAMCEGFHGASPTGRFTGAALQLAGGSVDVPPLSIVRIKMKNTPAG
jgi:alpha-L-arabinofuranosidase